MADHPLLFRPEMVRALLDGRKTQTRRPLYTLTKLTHWKLSAAQRIKPGDRVWVREMHSFGTYNRSLEQAKRRKARGQDPTVYGTDRARMKQYEYHGWRPSIHMPRWASRLTLAVTAVRIERLQDISEAGALAEGIVLPPNPGFADTARMGFAMLYTRIHGPQAFLDNPEVVVITFTVHKANIDAVEPDPDEDDPDSLLQPNTSNDDGVPYYDPEMGKGKAR